MGCTRQVMQAMLALAPGWDLLTPALGHHSVVHFLNWCDDIGNPEAQKSQGHVHPSPSQPEAESIDSGTKVPGLESQLCQ